MAHGDASQYEYIKGMEEAEFFNAMDSFKRKAQKKPNGKQ